MATHIEFERDLASAINRCSMENGSNTPDFILAGFLKNCLLAFNVASRERERWYGTELSIGGNHLRWPATSRPVFGATKT